MGKREIKRKRQAARANGTAVANAPVFPKNDMYENSIFVQRALSLAREGEDLVEFIVVASDADSVCEPAC
eukprot:scaffold187741_cov26-Prasinocladus_malaysianus.AAC.1